MNDADQDQDAATLQTRVYGISLTLTLNPCKPTLASTPLNVKQGELLRASSSLGLYSPGPGLPPLVDTIGRVQIVTVGALLRKESTA